MELSPIDRVYLARTYELARRGIGSVSPNPPVGAIIVHAGQTLGEGFHQQRGGPHAEVMALEAARAAGVSASRLAAATLYVSLEPCNHHGRTPPCSEAVIAAGFKRVVIGTLDPNPRTAGGGVKAITAARSAVVVADDPVAAELIAPFEVGITLCRPFVTLKLAATLNGIIAAEPGGQTWLTGPQARAFVRDLRTWHDIVLVGAGTLRNDNPDLRPRPPHTKLRPTLRGIVCGLTPPPIDRKIFRAPPDEARTGVMPTQTWLLVPAAARAQYETYRSETTEILYLEATRDGRIDVHAALQALREREIGSVLCEGGPTLATSLLQANCVDRLEWLLAPQLIGAATAVPVLTAQLGNMNARFERIERLGADLRISCAFSHPLRPLTAS